MIEYRIVEREYPLSGDVRYVVERLNGMEWSSVYTTPDLDKAKEIYTERLNKSNYTEKIITV